MYHCDCGERQKKTFAHIQSNNNNNNEIWIKEERNHIVSRIFYLASILPFVDAITYIYICVSNFGIFGMWFGETK